MRRGECPDPACHQGARPGQGGHQRRKLTGQNVTYLVKIRVIHPGHEGLDDAVLLHDIPDPSLSEHVQ